jgi:hypothetical protein
MALPLWHCRRGVAAHRQSAVFNVLDDFVIEVKYDFCIRSFLLSMRSEMWPDQIGRRVKLRQLEVLFAVTECGTMGKAAERLRLSQPVISKAIADLEHVLGVRLLDRSPQGARADALRPRAYEKKCCDFR